MVDKGITDSEKSAIDQAIAALKGQMRPSNITDLALPQSVKAQFDSMREELFGLSYDSKKIEEEAKKIDSETRLNTIITAQNQLEAQKLNEHEAKEFNRLISKEVMGVEDVKKTEEYLKRNLSPSQSNSAVAHITDNGTRDAIRHFSETVDKDPVIREAKARQITEDAGYKTFSDPRNLAAFEKLLADDFKNLQHLSDDTKSEIKSAVKNGDDAELHKILETIRPTEIRDELIKDFNKHRLELLAQDPNRAKEIADEIIKEKPKLKDLVEEYKNKNALTLEEAQQLIGFASPELKEKLNKQISDNAVHQNIDNSEKKADEKQQDPMQKAHSQAINSGNLVDNLKQNLAAANATPDQPVAPNVAADTKTPSQSNSATRLT